MNETPLKVMTITRTHKRDDGTFGVFDDEGQPFAVTLEPPRGAKDRYLIPPGERLCKRVDSPKFGNTFEITGVTGHDHLLFHPLNIYTETLGCVGVAEKFGLLNGQTAIQDSKIGFLEFLKRTEGLDQFKLVIREV